MINVPCGFKGLYLDTWRHGDVEVTEHMLVVLIFRRLAQERQKSSVFFTAVSHLRHTDTRTAVKPPFTHAT